MHASQLEQRTACKRAGIVGVTFNDLRGTAVTRLALAGCTEAEIATITGHSLHDVRSILDADYCTTIRRSPKAPSTSCERARSGRCAARQTRRCGAARVGRDWQQPELPPWEVAKRNPHERRPWAPGWEPDEVAAQQQWRERQRVRDAAQHAAAARYEGPQTPESTALAAARETAS
jgi:hypothetical protein